MLNRTLTTLSDGKELIEEILNEYPYVNDKVTEVANRIRNIQEEFDMNIIIQLLKQDPYSDKSYFTEPVVLHENTVFPVENYGSGMTPFYTVLSLWVGGLLLISILSTNVQYPENFHAREIYYGKRSEEHTSELQSRGHLVCRLLLEKKNMIILSIFKLNTI